jgi:hypothetical protein
MRQEMKTTGQTNPKQDFDFQFNRVLSMPQFVVWFGGIGFAIILLFGALIFSIAFGLFFGFVILASTFELPYRLFRRMASFEELPLHVIRRPIRRIVLNCALLAMPMLFIVIGVKGLQNIGFCSQALICTFSRLLAP